MDKTQEIFDKMLITHDQAMEVPQPSKQPLDLSSAAVTPQDATLLDREIPWRWTCRLYFWFWRDSLCDTFGKEKMYPASALEHKPYISKSGAAR